MRARTNDEAIAAQNTKLHNEVFRYKQLLTTVLKDPTISTKGRATILASMGFYVDTSNPGGYPWKEFGPTLRKLMNEAKDEHKVVQRFNKGWEDVKEETWDPKGIYRIC